MVLLANGCATLDEGECRTVDWYDLGIRDGSAGWAASRVEEHAKACADFGIRPDRARYEDGRRVGLVDYCRLENAFDVGLAGKTYHGVCPPKIDRQFRRYHAAAYGVYEANKKIDDIDQRISQLEQRLDKIRRKDDPKHEDERRDIRSDLRKLDRDRNDARDDLRRAERDLDRARDDFAAGR